MLGRAQRIARRGIHHDNALARGNLLIYVIRPDTGPHDCSKLTVAAQRVGI